MGSRKSFFPSMALVALMLMPVAGWALVKAEQGEVERVYPVNDVVVIDGTQYRLPIEGERPGMMPLRSLEQGMTVRYSASSKSDDNLKHIQRIEEVKE